MFKALRRIAAMLQDCELGIQGTLFTFLRHTMSDKENHYFLFLAGCAKILCSL